MARGQPAVVELELLPLRGNRAQPFQQRGCVRVEVDEDEVAEAFAAD